MHSGSGPAPGELSGDPSQDHTSTEQLDVVIVGAGLSGVGAACRLTQDEPGRTYAVLEARADLGGTWDLFRYPGVRSDSDMFTLGYDFRPWLGSQAIARGEDILAYVRETAAAYGVDQRIRTDHRVVVADWSSERARWLLRVARAGGEVVIECRFLWMCTGYYRYDHGYRPVIEGQDEFGGALVHPQEWPADLDVTGRDVVVLGSGATAITLVPALDQSARRVTMVQRSPSYVATMASRDVLRARLAGKVPARVLHRTSRAASVVAQQGGFALSRTLPRLVRWALRHDAARHLPPGYDVDTHFFPRYEPWDQRLNVTTDGDLFAALRGGSAEIVTGTVDRLTPTGVRLASGREVHADVVVTATGLELLALGGTTLRVDGRTVDPGAVLTYKGLMLAGVPNLAVTVGYVNASWTLRADLVARYVVRLLRRLDREGADAVTPVPSVEVERGPRRTLLDLKAGYVRRGGHRFPAQGSRWPWQLRHSYPFELVVLRFGPLTDGVRFTRRAARVAAAATTARSARADVPVR